MLGLLLVGWFVSGFIAWCGVVVYVCCWEVVMIGSIWVWVYLVVATGTEGCVVAGFGFGLVALVVWVLTFISGALLFWLVACWWHGVACCLGWLALI